MQYHWLNKQNNNKLIVFFAGWSFDFYPFEFLNCQDTDILFIYDYTTIDKPDENLFAKYSQKTLICWSMGVFVAYLLKDEFDDFDHKIAVNGTPYPVDDEFGIPLKPFLLTLRHAKTGLEKKFYQNVFNSETEFETYLKNPVTRTMENRTNELSALYYVIKTQTFDYSKFFDAAIISKYDKIIPTKNQLRFWDNNAIVKTLESGHFPFYNFKGWNEIVDFIKM